MIFDKLLTKYFLTNFAIKFILTWLNPWCQIQLVSLILAFIATKHCRLSLDRSSRSTKYTFLYLYPMNLILLPMELVTMQWNDSNEILNLLLYNWLILSKLCLKLFTNKRFSIPTKKVIWILLRPMIFFIFYYLQKL